MKSRKVIVPLFILFIGALGCGLFSENSNDAEMIFAATEVGTAEGDKVTKDIGPAGGKLASPDGRLTLTVPQNALTETIPFSIQPITNKAGNGIGLAYRLEPDGKTFTTPLEVSIRYDKKDLEGTIPEALSIAYQDGKRAWRAQNFARLDQTAKTLTISTTHFTDFAFLARLRMRPPNATVYVGGGQSVELTICEELGFFDKLRGVDPRDLCASANFRGMEAWNLEGAGTLDAPYYDEADRYRGAMYNAPTKKPENNIVYVDLVTDFEVRDSATGRISMVEGRFRTIITILDRGYRATGNDGGVAYSGVVCDLEKPFSVTGIQPDFTYTYNFNPTTSTGGTGNFSALGGVLSGSGPYTIEEGETGKLRIIWKPTVTGRAGPVSRSRPGVTYHIDLVQLDRQDCEAQ